MSDINRKMASGALWMGLLRFSVRGLGLISTVILARLLVPADFGLVAMATSVVAFLELATSFSFDVPLIQKQETERKHFDTAWTLNLIFYSGLTVLLIALAHPAAAFYQEPRLTDVIYVLAIGFLVKGFENIGVVLFRKELDFRKDFILMFTRKALSVLVAVPLAFYLRSYWALVTGIVVSNIAGVVLTYLLHPFRPRLSLAAAKEMLNFSKWLILNNAFGFLRLRSPDFVIGRISGSSSLGLFNIAFEISTLPTTELVAPINRAVFPGYAKLASDIEKLKQSYFDVLAIVALVALPAAFGISAIATPLVDLFLGDKWADAAPLIALLAVFGGISALQSNSASVFFARGKPHLVSVVALCNIGLLLGSAIPLAIAYGPIGVAFAYVGSYSLVAPVAFYLVTREVGSGLAAVGGVLWRPILACSVMYAAVRYTNSLLMPESLAVAGRLTVLVAVGAVVYASFVILLWLLAGRPGSAEYRLSAAALRKLTTKYGSAVHGRTG